MQTISEIKELAVTDTPIMVFDCVLSSGVTEHWSTHAVTIGATSYAARVLSHSAFDIQTASDQGVDGSPKISLVLANADSHFSEIERATGWKGASLTVGFLFYDLRNNVPLTDTSAIFQGICNPPDQIKEATFRLSAINRMSLQRLLLPEVRIERRCPWTFPATADQRSEAVDGGADGKYSLYYRCGYSADISGGAGSLNGEAPFTSCGYTRPDCQARGIPQRFGGIEYVPPVIGVRGYGKDWTTSALSVNQARYNDYVPMVYGTAWIEPLVVFARNDGNLTRMEVLLGIGQIQGVLTVLVSGVQIPMGVAGQNMTGTGWYNLITPGTRDGAYDMNFTNSDGSPAGDPYGSMAYVSVVVPNQLNDGNSLASVQVLMQGLIGSHLCRGRDLHQRPVLEQPGMDSAGCAAEERLDGGGDRPDEFRRGGGLLRRTNRIDGLERQPDYPAAVSMQRRNTEAEERGRRGARRSECGPPVPHVWTGRRAATPGGEFAAVAATGAERVHERHGIAGRRVAGLRIRGRQQRSIGHIEARERRAERDDIVA